MVICTKCGQQSDPGEAFCHRCGAFLEWTGAPVATPAAPPAVLPVVTGPRRATAERLVVGPAVVATLGASSVRVEPGAEASVTIEVLNRGRTVDQLSLEVLGPAADWSSVDPPRHNLMPDMSGATTVVFHPPRTPAVRPGPTLVDIAVRSCERPEASVTERVVVEVAPFVALRTALAPSVLRGQASTATRLQAANGGNVALDLALGGDDPEMALEFRFDPPRLRVDPGATAEAVIAVLPRAAIEAGPERTRRFRVIATASDGTRHLLDGTFIQLPLPAPSPPEPVPAGPPLLTSLSASLVRVEPGTQATVMVDIRNQGRVPDQLALDVRGPAGAWSIVDPARLNVVPEASAASMIVVRPPRMSSTRPGRYPAEVAVTSRAHPADSVVEVIVVEILPFVALETSLAPSVLRCRREATARLMISNRGNARVAVVVGGEDPELAFGFRISPSRLRLDPGSGGGAAITVRARSGNRARTDLARPFRVSVSAADGSRYACDGVLVQEAFRQGCWGRALAILLLPILVAVIAAGGVGIGWLVKYELRVGDELAIIAATLFWGLGGLWALRRTVGAWRGG